MKLQKLTVEAAKSLQGKELCCFGAEETYLAQLCKMINAGPDIGCIVDNNTRKKQYFACQDRKIPICGWNALEGRISKGLNQGQWVLVITCDYYWEMFEALCGIAAVVHNYDTIYFVANQETEYEEGYREFYKNTPLEDMILFRSGPHASAYIPGTDFSDNARALYEYMVSKGYNRKYRLVWLVKNPEEYKETENVCFLSFDWSVSEDKEKRDAYYHALCLSKYLFFTDAYGFARNCRPDQVRVQLWHGCGFKTRVNFVRCGKRYEYTTVISGLYAKIHQKIYGLGPEQVLVTGYAKQDWLFQPPRESLGRLFHVPEAEKYLFWLPTFREADQKLDALSEYALESATGLPIVDTREKLERLNCLLADRDAVLFLKLHPFQKRVAVSFAGFSNLRLIENSELLEMDLPLNRLLALSDGLLSDYSSAAVDYLLLDRPIGFLLEDIEEYEKSRGFVFHPIRDWLPGREIDTFEGLLTFIDEVARGEDCTREKRQKIFHKLHKYQDGGSCRRILEALKIKPADGREWT